MRFSLLSLLILASCAGPAPVPRAVGAHLIEWERGFAVQSAQRPDVLMYLWFYEWHMFDAVRKGQHTNGTFRGWTRWVNEAETKATIDAEAVGLKLTLEAVADGAKLTLMVTNKTGYDWPELASIIPCFSPGKHPETGAALTSRFANENTYFLAEEGLVKLNKREIHFNAELRSKVDGEARDGGYVWSGKWPKKDPDAVGGILIRESTGGDWVAGIAWEESLSSQGHNPWRCMHLSVNVGPLARGATRVVRGRIYLFPGTKEECLRRFTSEFGG